MSLLNAWVEPGRALVCVDTETALQSGRADTSKMIPLPAERMVIACRGNLYLLHSILQPILCSPSGIDGTAEMLPDLCDYYVQEFDQVAAIHDAPSFVEAEIVMVGWSEREQRMVGHACVRNAGDPNFRPMQIDSCFIGPNIGWTRPLPPDCPEHMEAIARSQVSYMREHHPDCAIGGRLLIAEVTQKAINIRELLKFPERA